MLHAERDQRRRSSPLLLLPLCPLLSFCLLIFLTHPPLYILQLPPILSYFFFVLTLHPCTVLYFGQSSALNPHVLSPHVADSVLGTSCS
ncbi:hypothetical protein C8R47DRAFT_1154557, partial [Mycena vitilis]